MGRPANAKRRENAAKDGEFNTEQAFAKKFFQRPVRAEPASTATIPAATIPPPTPKSVPAKCPTTSKCPSPQKTVPPKTDSEPTEVAPPPAPGRLPPHITDDMIRTLLPKYVLNETYETLTARQLRRILEKALHLPDKHLEQEPLKTHVRTLIIAHCVTLSAYQSTIEASAAAAPAALAPAAAAHASAAPAAAAHAAAAAAASASSAVPVRSEIPESESDTDSDMPGCQSSSCSDGDSDSDNDDWTHPATVPVSSGLQFSRVRVLGPRSAESFVAPAEIQTEHILGQVRGIVAAGKSCCCFSCSEASLRCSLPWLQLVSA